MLDSHGPCMCGADDCPSCHPNNECIHGEMYQCVFCESEEARQDLVDGLDTLISAARTALREGDMQDFAHTLLRVAHEVYEEECSDWVQNVIKKQDKSVDEARQNEDLEAHREQDKWEAANLEEE